MDKSELELKDLRKEIDSLDKLLLTVLKKRFKLVEKVSRVKKKLQLPTHQQSRWETMLQSRFKIAESLKLDQNFTLSFFRLVHKESKRIQLANKKDSK